uniref:uncharacterized protein LOC113475002 n=1 Tax=Ciona intestinalis TaxID=7719 RepID=UPI000EF4B070|nr:uncharacterized protein LOC113475002 [Ciona intestinalis]|eukprot:XP_026694125.1 uncharacterized protein LOC113475002 [Ciona intestinalis]
MSNFVERLENELKCPVCFANFKQNVISLPCQHKICEDCVIALCDCIVFRRCPVCRLNFTPTELRRDHTLENIIRIINKEKLSLDSETYENKEVTFNPDVVHCKAEKLDYKGSIKTLNVEKSGENTLLDKIRYLKYLQSIKVDKKTDDLLTEITHLASTTEIEDAFQVICGLNSIAESMSSRKCDGVLTLADIVLKRAASVQIQSSRLHCLLHTASYMQFVANTMAKSSKREQFSGHGLDILKTIFAEIERMDNLESSETAKGLAWCLKFTGVCCNVMCMYDKSLNVNKDALKLLEAEFGTSVCKNFRVYGMCQQNMGVAYKRLNMEAEARISFISAMESYVAAKDWTSDFQKQESLNRTLKCLKTLA